MIFDVRGESVLHQSNGFSVNLDIHQTFPDGSQPDAASEVLRGNAQAGDLVSTAMDGRVSENMFFLLITWNSGSQGEYHGTFFPTNRLSGITFDRTHPENQATWFIDHEFRIF